MRGTRLWMLSVAAVVALVPAAPGAAGRGAGAPARPQQASAAQTFAPQGPQTQRQFTSSRSMSISRAPTCARCCGSSRISAV